MNITINRIRAIQRRNEQLEGLLDSFISSKTSSFDRRGKSRIENDIIEEYINTSCHCHPVMEWVERGTLDEFVEWYNKTYK